MPDGNDTVRDGFGLGAKEGGPFAKLAELLSRFPSSSYKNRLDPVTGVPLTTLLFPYQEPAPFIELNSAPPSPDSWGVLADHHVALYLDGISKLGERP